MNSRNNIYRLGLTLAPLAILTVVPWQSTLAADVTATGSVTPKLFLFNFNGTGDGRTHFLERYNVQRSLDGDLQNGAYLDLDLDVRFTDGERDYLRLERTGYGRYNHRGSLRADSDVIGVYAQYSDYRSATGGIDYLFNPNLVAGATEPSTFFPLQTNANSGYLAQFNDDTGGRFKYKIDRTSFGAGLEFKPALLGDHGRISFDFDGYRRDGNRFATTVFGGGDIRQAGTNDSIPQRVLQRWRGFDQEVDETMTRFAVSATFNPIDDFRITYEGSIEDFENDARSFVHADVEEFLPAGFQYNTGGDNSRPLGFIPDTTLTTNALRASGTVGRAALAAGYSKSTLEQESFTQPQKAAGFDNGEITNHHAYFNAKVPVSRQVTLDGSIRYRKRDNDSDFPVPGLIDNGPGTGEVLGVRIDEITTFTYELAARVRVPSLNSTLTPGWKRVDTDRDLTFHSEGIIPTVSFLREDTDLDEFYLKWVARPVSGLTLRVTPSYINGDDTGLVTEPEKARQVKAQASYASSANAVISGFFDYRKTENSNNRITDKMAPLASHKQDRENTQRAAGFSVNLVPSTATTAYLAFSWHQNDFDALFYQSDRRRFEAAPVFQLKDRTNYDVDSYVFGIGGDWLVRSGLRFDAGYTLAKSDGHTATGLDGESLPVADATIDNILHSVVIGMDYELSKQLTLQGEYTYDYYNDDVNDRLSGGLNNLMVGLEYKF